MGTITKEIGRISIVPKGSWDDNSTYSRLDLVTHEGSSYIAKQDVPVNINLNNNNYWMPIAQKGFSPNVTITNITGGHQINITDGQHQQGQSFNVIDGVNAYIYFCYSEVEPTSDNQIKNTPDNWMGVCASSSPTAPVHYTDYTWFKIKGETGLSITSITKTGTSQDGLTDTYTINFSDNITTYTFNVRHGTNISSIQKTSTNPNTLEDTFTVTLTDGSTTSFTVKNGRGISSITEVDVNHLAGHTDVYRINFNDGTTFNFSIYNGTNGTGSISSVDDIPSTNQDVKLLTIGNDAPTSSTVGNIKSRYFDASHGVLYICVGIDTSGAEATYSWVSTGGVVVDSVLSTTSTNPVQNSIITSAIYTIINKIGGGSLLISDTLIGAINSVYLSKASRGVIASGYSSSSTYAVGDCVMRSNAPNAYSMYRCIVPIETPESWTEAHWQLVTVAEELAKKYEKPSGGIPDSDIVSAAVWNAKGTYSKPGGGIPETDLNANVVAKLNAKSDWDENDSNNPSYIANRTHYAYTVYDTPVYEKTVMSVGDISSPDLTYNDVKYKRVEAGTGESTLLGDGKYKITLGDTEWIGYKTVVSDQQVSTYRLYAEEIGVIYQEAYPPGAIVQQVYLAENTDGGSIDVYQGTENVVKIDNKYLNLSAYRTASAQDTIDAGKQTKIAASGMLKGDGNGGVTAATAGIDYQTPLTAGSDYLAPSALASYRTAAAQDTIDVSKQAAIKKKTVSLSTSWSGSGPYTQTVTISGYTITANSKVDLQQDATVISRLVADKVQGLYIENNNGVLTAVAVGAAPTAALTIQCTIMEVQQ